MLLIDDQMNISMTRGDTPTINLFLTDANGAPYDCTNDQELVFSVKKNYSDTAIIEIPITRTMYPKISIGMADTWNKDPGDYYYDIKLVTANGMVDTFIANKRFTILPEAHDIF